MMKIPTIAMIGGGFSGALVLAQLVKMAEGACTIDWFEPRSSLSKGVAYSTQESIHLLNVRADRIGAFAGEPEGFFQWLQSGKGQEQAKYYGVDVACDAFVPRALYGDYLETILKATLHEAISKQIEVRIHPVAAERVVYNETSHRVEVIAGNLTVNANALVLATGNLPPSRFDELSEHPRFVADVWQPSVRQRLLNDAPSLSAQSHVVIIGTGLTMIDTVLTLSQAGYKGTIVALSRNGLLPTVHMSPGENWPVSHPLPKSALGILVYLRSQVRMAAAQGINWRSVIDGLRAETPHYWRTLPVTEKKKIMKRLLTFWSIHRHRMAPSIAAQLEALKQSGKLHIMAGHIESFTPQLDSIDVKLRDKHQQEQCIHASLLVSCVGPELVLKKMPGTLMQSLIAQELLAPNATGLGVQLAHDGSATSKWQGRIFCMGTLQVGELLECTAVPELREQAAHVAKALTKCINEVRERGY